MTVRAYPLQWPAGWPRTRDGARATASFGRVVPRESKYTGAIYQQRERLTLGVARHRLVQELERLGGEHATLSTDVPLRLDGIPFAGKKPPEDPGAAVYFTLGGRQIALACDKWNAVEDNVAALAKHIEAMRGMERWGVGTASQAFAGYTMLPPPEPWWKVLGLGGPTQDRDIIRSAWAVRSREAHPDRPGGSHDKMAAVNLARDQGLEQAH